jgi:preprotein translocase subunit SecA
MLTQRGVPIANWLKKGDVTQELESGKFHTVLNAKYHKQEAEIITKAGLPGMINIATNMAGRGTDIKLSPEVVQKGGLHIIGSEKHEARRIDRQLRGRSGRQGDPGSSRFYLSLEDDLMRLFGSDRITNMMSRLGPMEEGERIEHPLITKSIERAQKKVEERNFEIRKNLLEYDTVLNEQRKIIYKRRQNLLGYASAEDFVESKAKRYFNEEDERVTWNLDELIARLQAFFKQTPDFSVIDLEKYKADEIKTMVLDWVEERLEEERFFLAMQLRHRLLGFANMDELINEIVRLKIRLHNAGTRDTARWNLDGISYEMDRIFKKRPDVLQAGSSLGDAETVEKKLSAWARNVYGEKMHACAAVYDSALFARLTMDEMVQALLSGLMMIHLSPLSPVVSWTTEDFLNDVQRMFGDRPVLGVNEMRSIRREKIFDVVLAWMNERRRGMADAQLRHRIIGYFSTIQFSQAVVYAMVDPTADEDELTLSAEQRQMLTELFGADLSAIAPSKEKRAWQVLAEKVLQARTEAMREQVEEYKDALLADATIEECIEATVAIVARQFVYSAAPLEARRLQLGNAMEFMLMQRPPRTIPEKQDDQQLAVFVEELVAWALALYKTYADREERIQQEELSREILRDSIAMMIDDTVYAAISTALEGQEDLAPHQLRKLEADCRLMFRQTPRLADDTDRLMSPADVMTKVSQWAQGLYQKRIDEIGADAASRYERFYVLEKIDENWRQHLNGVDELREGIGLRGYGQKDPLLEYKGEAYQMFVKMIDRINREVVSTLFRVFDVGGELEEQHLRRSEPRNFMTSHSQVDVFKQSAAAPAQAAAAHAPAPAQAPRTVPIVKSISIGRNDPCPCGSGKKYKQCCGKNL